MRPEDRKPRRSGPSGKHKRIEGDELAAQREAMARDVEDLSGIPLDVRCGLPWGEPASIAELLGITPARVREMWAGRRRYSSVAKIL